MKSDSGRDYLLEYSSLPYSAPVCWLCLYCNDKSIINVHTKAGWTVRFKPQLRPLVQRLLWFTIFTVQRRKKANVDTIFKIPKIISILNITKSALHWLSSSNVTRYFFSFCFFRCSYINFIIITMCIKLTDFHLNLISIFIYLFILGLWLKTSIL